MKTLTKVNVLPERETHVRELCRLETESEAAEVWQLVVESAGDQPITAKLIRDRVNEHLGYEPPEPDYYVRLCKLWERLSEPDRQRFVTEILRKESAA